MLVVDRRGRAGQIVDLVDLDKERKGHVVAHELEARIAEEMLDVLLGAGEKIVEAENFVPIAESRRSTRCEPRNPAPPVTRIRLRLL